MRFGGRERVARLGVAEQPVGKFTVRHALDGDGRQRVHVGATAERVSAAFFFAICLENQRHVLPRLVQKRLAIRRFEREGGGVGGFPSFGNDAQAAFLFHCLRGKEQIFPNTFAKTNRASIFPKKQIFLMSTPTPRHLNFVPAPGYFIGRDQLLKDIHHALNSNETVALVHGVGGVGKTTAALAYAHHERYAMLYRHVIFLVAGSNLQQDFMNSQLLVQNLGLTETLRQLPPEQYYSAGFELIREALRRLDGDVLLILDNFNNREALLAAMPTLATLGCRTLLTSRAELDDVARIPVDVLPLPDAVTLFCHHYGRTPESLDAAERADLEGFLADIWRHTLLTEMMAKVARKARYSPAQLRRYIAEGFIRHRDLQYPVGAGAHGLARQRPEATVNDYVRFLFADVLDLEQSEKDFLCCMAVLPQEVYSQERLLLFFPSRHDDPTAFWIFIAGLHERGIPLLAEGGYALHPLLREAVLQDLQPDVEQCREVVKAVTNLLYIDQAKDNPVDKFPFLPYGDAIVSVIKEENKAEMADLLDSMGWVYKEMGLLQRAVSIYERALTIALVVYGKDHINVAARRSNLALVYTDLGDNNRACELQESALENFLKNLGEQHPHVAICRSNLANIYRQMRDYEKARGLLELALDSDLKNVGENHPQVAIRRSILGLIYYEIGENEKSRDLLELALVSDLTNFGENHPNVDIRRSNLANVYRELGEYEKARDLLKLTLINGLNNFGENHPSVATRYNNLAHVFHAIGDFSQAKAYFQKALDIWLQAFGEQHPYVAQVRQSLAALEEKMKQKGV